MAKDERTIKTLFDLLSPVMESFISELMVRAKVKTQAEFAEGTPCDANDISRYVNGNVVPLRHLPALGARAGCGAGETGWLLGLKTMEYYERYRPDPDDQPDEIREPRSRYDERSLERELETVMELDFTPLGPEEMVAMNLERNQLRAACEETQNGIEREVAVLLALVSGFRERAEKKLSLATRLRRRT